MAHPSGSGFPRVPPQSFVSGPEAEADQETTRLLVYATEVPASEHAAQSEVEQQVECTMPLASRLGAAMEPPPPPAFYVDPEITTFSLPTPDQVVPPPPPLLAQPRPEYLPPLGLQAPPSPSRSKPTPWLVLALGGLLVLAAGSVAAWFLLV